MEFSSPREKELEDRVAELEARIITLEKKVLKLQYPGYSPNREVNRYPIYRKIV